MVYKLGAQLNGARDSERPKPNALGGIKDDGADFAKYPKNHVSEHRADMDYDQEAHDVLRGASPDAGGRI